MTLESKPESPTAGPAAPGPALALRGIHKSFGPKHVLVDADLELEPGSLTWLGGRNGAGKTTLLRIAGGLIAPDAGLVTLDGVDPDSDRRAYQRRLGYVSAGNLGLYARLSVADNLDFFASIALLPPDRRRRAIERAIARFDLGELARSRTDRISTGQRQRVRLAVAFLHDPAVVLLDEPHTSLDDDALSLLRRTLEEHAAGGGSALWCAPSPDHTGLEFDRGFRVEGGRVVPA